MCIKRIVSLILILVLCITCFVFPAAAAGLTSELTSIYDLLDFVSINSDGTNFLSVDGNYTFVIPSYEYTTYYYIDTTVRISGSAADFTAKIGNSLNGSTRNLTVSKIYGSLYRIYGEIPAASYRNFYLTINSNVPEKRGYTFYSFRVTSAQATAYPISCTYEVVSMQGGNEGSISAGGYANVEIPYGDFLNYPAPGEFSASVWIQDWYNYDFITLQLGGYYVYGNTAFNVTFNGQPLPYEISYTNLDVELGDSPIQSSDGSYMVFCTIDLRGVKRTLDTSVHIDMRGIHDQSEVSYFFISYVNGFVDLKEPNFLKSLYLKLGSWFPTLISKIDQLVGSSSDQQDAEDFTGVIEEEVNELGEISTVIGSMEKPNVSDFNFNINSMVSPSTLTLSTSGIKTALSNEILLKVLIIAMTLGLCGFILYGKK